MSDVNPIITTSTVPGFIIEGVTEEGQPFRPSDWAERMCGHLSTFRNRRMYYSPMLRPAMCSGVKCVIVDKKLSSSNPNVYQEVLSFVQTNKLRVSAATNEMLHEETVKKP